MDHIAITVHRYNPEKGAYIEKYEVPLEKDRVYSVLNVLDYIARRIDPTLAYFDHAACRQGACKKCLVKIDGKVSPACTERIGTDELELEPCGGAVIKDLICGPGE
ncbi:MAG: hypothetical protein LBI86_05485 [Treponema sp.]|jgi:succinate dehydrogenase / fumarate reductase iron-sulfur subunit|nr:hypothetical protein [Treponema sp.]